MRLPEPIETLGSFWFPADPEARKSGILRVSDSGEVTLELIEVFDQQRYHLQAIQDIGKRLKRIVGTVKEGGPVTLDLYLPPQSYRVSKSAYRATYRARFAFIGVDCVAGEELTFSGLSFSVKGLDEWLSVPGIHLKHDLEHKRGSIDYRCPEEISLSLRDGIELKFRFDMALPDYNFFQTNIHTRMSIIQTSQVVLTLKEPKPIEYFESLIFKLCNFFSFAMNETVDIDSMAGYLERGTENGKNPKVPIKICGEIGYPFETKSEIFRSLMVFTYKDIEDQCEEILKKWLDIYQTYEISFNLYFASISGAVQNWDVKFLWLVQGIEVLHRRRYQDMEMPEDEFKGLIDSILDCCPEERKKWLKRRLAYANEISLRQRIKVMIEPFRDWFGTKKEVSRFVDSVVNTRNHLTHYDDSEPEAQTLSVEYLWKLCRKLEALFQEDCIY